MDIFPEIDSAYERLENGLEVRHIRCRYFAAVGISVVVRTGNIHEGAMCGCGVSHFAEHMAFVGAGGRREESVSADAAMLGAELNAYTSHDRTVYFADCPTESLGKTLSLLSEMLFEPNFTEGAFEKERDVILREIDMCSDDAGEKVYDNLFRKMYISSPLRYPVIGLKKKFTGVRPPDLRGYFQDRYSADNMCVCVASALGHSEVFDAVSRAFGGRGGNLKPVMVEQELPQQCPREVLEYSNCDVSKCLLAFKVPCGNSVESAFWDCAAMSLGEGNSSILKKKLKYGENLVDYVGAYFFSAGAESALILSWECAAKNAESARETAAREVEKFARTGFSEMQISRYAKTRHAAVTEALRNSHIAADRLSDCAYLGAGLELYAHRAKSAGSGIFSNSADFLSARLDFGSSTYSAVLPGRSKPRVRRKAAPSPGFKIETRELPNGLKIAAITRKGLSRTNMRLCSFGGICGLDKPERDIYKLASICLLRGTSNRTFEEISELVENNAISFYGVFSDYCTAVCAESLPGDLPISAGLISDAALNFKIDSKIFESERRAAISRELDGRDDPLTFALRGLRMEFFGAYPLSSALCGDADAMKVASPADAEKVLSKVFPADKCAITAVGDFDSAEFLDDCESRFSGLARGCASLRKKAAFSFPKAREKVVKMDREKEQSVVFSAFSDAGAAEYKYKAVRAILLEYLGGENGEIFNCVRQRHGLSYSASASVISGADAAALYFYALTSHKNTGKVSGIFSEISERLAEGKIDERKFEAARSSVSDRFLEALCDPAEMGAYAAISQILRGEILTPEEVAREILEVDIQEGREYAARVFSREFKFIMTR
ncbi:MAG TPA: insulinase family protein [Candidatus Merdousia gallistercoris]|nr:insulinase family protein [Candidatus Merdousia gallistercoris]